MAKMNRKGIIFTAGLTLFALTILSFSSTTVFYRHQMQELTYSAAAMVRATNAFNTAGNDLKDIILSASGINVSIDGNVVTFTETIPNPSAPEFQSILEYYQNFSGAHHDRVNVTITELSNHLKLVIKPHEVNYTHPVYGGIRIRLEPAGMDFEKYVLELETIENITNCSEDVPAGNNNITVEVTVTGELSGCSTSFDVDPSQTSSLDINEGSLIITITPGGMLEVENNFASQVNVTSSIYLVDEPDNLVGVYLPDDIIDASQPSPQVLVKGSVKVI